MRCELPELGRCCFCFPLRIGLLVWSYIKLIINFVLLFFMIIIIKDVYRALVRGEIMLYFIILSILAALISLDIIFHVIFAVSAHKKDYKKMEWFYKFSIFVFGIYILGFCLTIAGLFSSVSLATFSAAIELYLYFTSSVLCLFCIITQVYVIILIRSEVLKLQRDSKHSNLEFVNKGAEVMDVKVDLSNPAA